MKYTNEHVNYLIANVRGISFKELTDKFNHHFNLTLSIIQVKAACKNRGLKCGRNTRFNKGNVPFNSGTKGLMKPNKTSFLIGNIPHNHKTVGSERLSKNGYFEVKIAEPKTWRLKHLVIWENVYGKLPKHHAVIFKDSNRTSINIDNLMLVHRSQLAYLNRNKLTSTDPIITETAANIARIAVKVSELCINQKN